MSWSKIAAVIAAAFVVLVGGHAHAFSPQADCERWSTYSPWGGGPAYAAASIVLERLEGDTYVPFDGGTDAQWYRNPEPGEFNLGSMWAAGVLPRGTYRAHLVVTVYNMLYTEPTPEVLASHPYTFRFGPNSTASFDCEGPITYTDSRTPGFWKNHASAWPASSLSIGGRTYTQQCLLNFFDAPTRGDLRVILIHHLVAAKLNILNQSDPTAPTGYPNAGSRIGDTISAADAYLSSLATQIDCARGTLSGSPPKGASKDTADALKNALDNYNNGY